MPSTNGHGPKRAILYARVSTEEQARSGYSLAQQMEALREYANREGYEVVEEITDPGESGASLERPGMDRVRDLASAGRINVVLTQDRDRYARDPILTGWLRREFEEYGCRLQALNDRGDDSPEGDLTDGILDQLAKYERAKTAERTLRGKLRRAREGKIVPTHTPDYGFKFNAARDNYIVDELEMAVVRRIFRMIGAEAMSMHSVKKVFEHEGCRRPVGAYDGTDRCFAAACSTTCTNPTPSKRCKGWWHQKWPPVWILMRTTVYGGSTADGVGASGSRRTAQTEGLTAGSPPRSSSPKKSG